MASTPPSSPKKMQKRPSKRYSACLLYNTGEALARLTGLTLAACNPTKEDLVVSSQLDTPQLNNHDSAVHQRADFTSVSDKMSCNYCNTDFSCREDQINHYKSDWHRYNLRLRLRGRACVTDIQFTEISECVSSISGSESDESDTEDVDRPRLRLKPGGLATQLRQRRDSYSSSNDSETELPSVIDDASRKYPKLFFRNKDGELLSLYRCVLYHKKNQPASMNDLVTIATNVPHHLTWAVLMAAGGHFAAAIFDKNTILAQKTFHRYVVRAKRGTAQGSRDSQGNAPKSAGASLRRYNEAALRDEVQELFTSWSEEMNKCDLIFLRAPSFNKRMFFSGKTPPLQKKDERIRMIPFATRRPTHNEVRRVHELLCSVECYGDESDIQDFVPLSPHLAFSTDTGHMEPVPDEPQTSPRHRRIKDKAKLKTSPLVGTEQQASGRPESAEDKSRSPFKCQQLELLDALRQENQSLSSGASTCSDSDLVECMVTLSTADLKEFNITRKSRPRKPRTRKRRPSLKRQIAPESDAFEEERYHLKNSLYTACKLGDFETLQNLLAIFTAGHVQTVTTQSSALRSDEGAKSITTDSENSQNSPQKESSITTMESENRERINQNEANQLSMDSKNSNQNNAESDSENGKNISQTETNIEIEESKDRDIECTRTSHAVCGESVTTGEHQRSGDDIQHDNVDVEIVVTDNVNINSTEREKMNLDVSHKTLQGPRLEPKTEELPSPMVSVAILNEPIGDQLTTLLHVAAKEGHKKVIGALLESGADPSVKDKFGMTAYVSTSDKEARNEFRRFMARFPDKYDYEAAKIPCPLTEDMETERRQKGAERKKVQRKAKQEKMKDIRAEEAGKKREEAEKMRFLSLSDREKRALAAEKRLVKQSVVVGGQVPVLSRCFQCAKDMTGKVPFEYNDYKFCTTKCLKEHRLQKTTR